MKKEVKEKSGDPGWVEFCQRMNINPNLVMLKVTLFVMYGGKNYNFFFSILNVLLFLTALRMSEGQLTLRFG